MTIIPALQGADIQIPGTTWALAAGPDAIPVALGMRHTPVATDCETFGLGALAWQLKCVVFSDGHSCAVLDPRDPKQHGVIKRVLADAPKLLMWNASFDAPTLYQNGLLNYESIDKIEDGLLHARLATPDTFTPKSLEAVGDRCGVRAKGKPISQTFKELGISKAEGFHKFDINVASYLYGAALDGLVTYHVTPMSRDDAKKTLLSNPYASFKVTGSELNDLIEREQIVNRVFLRRACKGMQVDFDFAEQYRKENQHAIDSAEAQLKELGIKPGDGGSLTKWMDSMGLIGPDHPKTPTGKLQATAAVLEDMTHPVAQAFVDAKRLVKVRKDYIEGLADLSKPTGGRVHPRTNVLAAVTGRSSVSSPPLQQMPPAARGILTADEGDSLSSIDFSQIEPYVIANIAGDLAPLKGYENRTSDMYTDIAAFASARGIDMPRPVAKMVLLAALYGQGKAQLTKKLGLDPGPLVEREDGSWTHTYDEARDIQDRVFEVLPQTQGLMKRLTDVGKRHRCVPTISGRVVPLSVFRNRVTGAEEVGAYRATNYLVQGSSYDLLASAVARCHKEGLADSIYLGIHDEILCSTSVADYVQRIMESPDPAFVRAAERQTKVGTERKDHGKSWAK